MWFVETNLAIVFRLFIEYLQETNWVKKQQSALGSKIVSKTVNGKS